MLLNADPVAAVIDTWAFIFQMKNYMVQSAAKEAFGESHSVVAETIKNMDAEMERLVVVAAPSANIADLRQKVVSFAEAHPIQASLAGRQSADPEMIRRVGATDLGTMASVKALGESLGDLTARLNAYNAYFPKQARWQAELTLSDLARDPRINSAMTNAAALSKSLETTSASMERLPEVMDETREAAVGDLEGQRLAGQAFLRQERLETLATLQQERIATLAAMRGERVAATSELRQERKIVLDALHNDEIEIMNQVNATVDKATKDFDARSRSLIDHFFVRAFELVLVTLVLCSLVAWILLRRYSFRRWGRGGGVYDRAA